MAETAKKLIFETQNGKVSIWDLNKATLKQLQYHGGNSGKCYIELQLEGKPYTYDNVKRLEFSF